MKTSKPRTVFALAGVTVLASVAVGALVFGTLAFVNFVFDEPQVLWVLGILAAIFWISWSVEYVADWIDER